MPPHEQQGAIAYQEWWNRSQALRNSVELLHWVCAQPHDDLSSVMKSFVLCPILQCSVQSSIWVVTYSDSISLWQFSLRKRKVKEKEKEERGRGKLKCVQLKHIDKEEVILRVLKVCPFCVPIHLNPEDCFSGWQATIIPHFPHPIPHTHFIRPPLPYSFLLKQQMSL